MKGPFDIVISILVSIALALAGFTLNQIYQQNARMARIEEQIQQSRSNTDIDTRQNKTMIKHWQLHGWARDEINKLRHNAGLDPTPWPVLQE